MNTEIEALQDALNAALAGTGKRVIMGAELDRIVADRIAQREREAAEREKGE